MTTTCGETCTRRGLAALALAGAAGLALPLRAETNPMPEELRKAIERQPFAPVLGNPDGDITLTEFFDYNCPYCRMDVPVVKKLIAGDPGLRVVFREWPIFGEDSLAAAQVSLATLKQGKYLEFHAAMMAGKGRAGLTSAMRVAKKLGLDTARLKRDMDSAEVTDHIEHSMALADHMGLTGTPTWIAGDGGAFGYMTLGDLQNLVTQARKDLR